jgi:hypothetical protein
LLPRALEIGVKEGITVYDALFVTLAANKRVKLLTTDEKLHSTPQSSKEFSNITLLPKANRLDRKTSLSGDVLVGLSASHSHAWMKCPLPQ